MTHTETTNAGGDAAAKSVTQRKRETRRDQLIRMLRRKTGADAPAISERMGWRPHSTRAALSGLRKAGFEIEATKPAKGGPTRYRIIKEPSKAAA